MTLAEMERRIESLERRLAVLDRRTAKLECTATVRAVATDRQYEATPPTGKPVEPPRLSSEVWDWLEASS